MQALVETRQSFLFPSRHVDTPTSCLSSASSECTQGGSSGQGSCDQRYLQGKVSMIMMMMMIMITYYYDDDDNYDYDDDNYDDDDSYNKSDRVMMLLGYSDHN